MRDQGHLLIPQISWQGWKDVIYLEGTSLSCLGTAKRKRALTGSKRDSGQSKWLRQIRHAKGGIGIIDHESANTHTFDLGLWPNEGHIQYPATR
jgi:hypothetical protein